MDRTNIWRILNVIGLALVLLVNILANSIPINGQTTGEVSANYSNLFVPAGFTFSIWGLIYLLLIGFSIFQIIDRGDDNRRSVAAQIGPWFFISCLANAAWIFAWHYEELGLSLGLMLLLLFSLRKIYVRLRIGTNEFAFGRERFWSHLPFSVYLGWISVATIANVAAFLTAWGWQGGGISEPVWAALVIGVATILGIWFLLKRADVPYALVICWAFTGILIRYNGLETAPLAPIITLSVGLSILLILAVSRFSTWYRGRPE